LDGASRMRLGEAHLLDASRRAPLHLADDARHYVRASAVAIGFLLALVQHIDAVPGRGRMIDEALAALLAVGQEVDDDLLLRAQCRSGDVVWRGRARRPWGAKGAAAAVGARRQSGARRAAVAGPHQGGDFHRGGPRLPVSPLPAIAPATPP